MSASSESGVLDFPLFVYGTLQRGFPAHARWCRSARFATEACCRGRLFRHEEGYPALVVGAERVLALGSANAWDDARRAATGAQDGDASHSTLMIPALAAPELDVEGELLLFACDRIPLAGLDAYEGYEPGTPSLFVRVLLDIEQAGGGNRRRAWTYVAGRGLAGAPLQPLTRARWGTPPGLGEPPP